MKKAHIVIAGQDHLSLYSAMATRSILSSLLYATNLSPQQVILANESDSSTEALERKGLSPIYGQQRKSDDFKELFTQSTSQIDRFFDSLQLRKDTGGLFSEEVMVKFRSNMRNLLVYDISTEFAKTHGVKVVFLEEGNSALGSPHEIFMAEERRIKDMTRVVSDAVGKIPEDDVAVIVCNVGYLHTANLAFSLDKNLRTKVGVEFKISPLVIIGEDVEQAVDDVKDGMRNLCLALDAEALTFMPRIAFVEMVKQNISVGEGGEAKKTEVIRDRSLNIVDTVKDVAGFLGKERPAEEAAHPFSEKIAQQLDQSVSID